MKLRILIILSIFTIWGCKKDNPIKSGITINRVVDFSILNSQNEDLLSFQKGFIDTTAIKIYFVIDGKEILYHEPRYDSFKSGWLYLSKSEYNTPENRIAIICNSSELDGKSITYIDWKENYRDTIEATFFRPNGISGSLIIDKIWLNGTLSWERGKEGETDPYFILRK